MNDEAKHERIDVFPDTFKCLSKKIKMGDGVAKKGYSAH